MEQLGVVAGGLEILHAADARDDAHITSPEANRPFFGAEARGVNDPYLAEAQRGDTMNKFDLHF